MSQRKRRPFSRQTARQKSPKSTLSKGQYQAQVTTLLSDGRGLANVDGNVVMIDGALPDETVLFEYRNQKKQFFEGQMVEVLKASSARITPRCEAFHRCGGCALQHLQADEQIAHKQQQLLINLQKQAKIKPKVLANPLTAAHWGYRHRARVGIKRVGQGDNAEIHVGFRGRHRAEIEPITNCAVLIPELSALLVPIAKLVANLSSPDSFTHVEMSAGDSALSLNFRHVCPLTEADLTQLSAFAEQQNVLIYLQSGDENSVKGLNHQRFNEYHIDIQTDNDKVNNVGASPLTMAFMPYHFTQVNFSMNQKMLQQAMNWLDLQADDEVLDLFCGLGNFSLPMVQRVKSVVGIEGSQALVDWAKQNAENNGLSNTAFYRADLTQDTRMMTWRVKRQYNKVLIDPPRSGALEIMPLIAEITPEKVCYVSCHSATLARDVNVLVNDYGYRLVKAGVMDMFPHTAHVESMALLQRKSSIR